MVSSYVTPISDYVVFVEITAFAIAKNFRLLPVELAMVELTAWVNIQFPWHPETHSGFQRLSMPTT